MSLMEFYNVPANQSVPVVKIGVKYPTSKEIGERMIAVFGGKIETIEPGYGEGVIPETRVGLIVDTLSKRNYEIHLI